MVKIILFLILNFAFSCNLNAQNFKVLDNDFYSQKIKKKIFLLKDSTTENKLIFFKTSLAVNTDGTPLSYHPFDLRGYSKALNNIGNAIVINRDGSTDNLCLTNYGEAISVFEKYRDSKYEMIPSGYSITWTNVLIPVIENGIIKPCIIKTGEYAGYFASATSLKNGLVNNKGECECENQVNSLKVQSFVVPSGNNLIKRFGALVGDLLVAYNPVNSKLVFAIINDEGPPNKLGEGSVLLNMSLLDKKIFPKNKKDTYQLAIKNEILIAIIPNSKEFNIERPYTAENVNSRVHNLLNKMGFENDREIIDFLKSIIEK